MHMPSDEAVKNLASRATEFWTGRIDRIIIIPPEANVTLEDGIVPDYKLESEEGTVLGYAHGTSGSGFLGLVRVAALKNLLSRDRVPYAELVRRSGK